MSEHVIKSHNKTLILYHIVCPAKYRREVFSDEVEETFKEICLEIGKRYEVHFVEIGSELEHVHFLVQSIPTYAPTRIVQIIKSVTARELFKRHPEAKKKLWGGQFWTKGYYLNTVGQYGNEEVIQRYIQKQGGKDYKQVYRDQLTLFDGLV